jgi:hypothetical protein
MSGCYTKFYTCHVHCLQIGSLSSSFVIENDWFERPAASFLAAHNDSMVLVQNKQLASYSSARSTQRQRPKLWWQLLPTLLILEIICYIHCSECGLIMSGDNLCNACWISVTPRIGLVAFILQYVIRNELYTCIVTWKVLCCKESGEIWPDSHRNTHPFSITARDLATCVGNSESIEPVTTWLLYSPSMD